MTEHFNRSFDNRDGDTGMLDFRTPYLVRFYDTATKHEGSYEFAIRSSLIKKGEYYLLMYSNFERGHMLEGQLVKRLKNGIVFDNPDNKIRLTLTKMTMDDFDQYVRPRYDEYVNSRIHDLDDAQVFMRRQEGIV